MRPPTEQEPGETYFSPHYFEARRRFREAALESGATLDALRIAASGPRGEALTIDIARLGAPDARRVLLHVCGLHGVEAFAGSAVQLAFLERPPTLPADAAVILVHVLNPYGMAWLRRANENNVDLNRNFLRPGEQWVGAASLYTRLDPLINPPSAPAHDFFRARIALLALRHGVRAPSQAVAEGQYEHPRGLFYGGRELEEGPRLLLEWLRSATARAEYLFAADMHTGLGAYGESTLIIEPDVNATAHRLLSCALGHELLDPAADEAAYRARGTLGAGLRAHLTVPRMDFVLQEIGTRHSFVVLHALREENRSHHYVRNSLTHPAKRALRRALSPGSARWRRLAVSHGTALLSAAARWTFAPDRS